MTALDETQEFADDMQASPFARRAALGTECRSEPMCRADRDHGRAADVDRVDDLRVLNALEVDRGDAEVAVAELALDDDERYAFVGYFDGVSVPELMWSEPSPEARCDGRAPQHPASALASLLLCARSSGATEHRIRTVIRLSQFAFEGADALTDEGRVDAGLADASGMSLGNAPGRLLK